MIRLPLDYYGYGKNRGVIVDLEDEYRTVHFCVEAETETGQDTDITLTTNEARALAAMLAHYANEAERPR